MDENVPKDGQTWTVVSPQKIMASPLPPKMDKDGQIWTQRWTKMDNMDPKMEKEPLWCPAEDRWTQSVQGRIYH